MAAQALVRMAECHQKIGGAQAQTVYARIVRDYADQTDAVTTARARIAAPGAGPGAGAVTERVAMTTIGAGLVLDSVTPDGRFGVGADQASGDLVTRDMTTGEVTRILRGTVDPRSPDRNGASVEGGSVEMGVMSPDQGQVAGWQARPLRQRPQ